MLSHANFQKALKNFWHDWQQQKPSYHSLSLWWEKGKMYLKMLSIHYCVESKKNIRNKQEQLTLFLNTEKMKQDPDLNKTNKAQNQLEDIQNFKDTGSIIRSREKLIIKQEKPNKYFFDHEKQKQKNKTIKQLQDTKNNETEIITSDYEILKYCKIFFSNLYTKTQTNIQIQKELLTPIQPKPKINNKQNEKLTQEITLNELKTTIFQIENAN